MGDVAGKQKHIFIEVLRIIACFLAMVNHSTALYYDTTAMIYWESPTHWFVSLVYLYLTKIAIPVFVMISGYNMLDKIDNYKKSGKRLLRIVLVLLVFSSIYYLNLWKKGMIVDVGIIEYLKSLYRSPQAFSHWYLYMYMGVLLMMPFLQRMVANMNKLDCQIMIGISLYVSGFLPMVEHIWPEMTSSKIVDLSIFTSFINMLLIGHYMKKYMEPTKKLFISSIVIYCVILVFNIWVTYCEFFRTGGINYFFYENRCLATIIIQSACFFNIIRYIKWKESWMKWIKIIGGCTFGMYLINDFIIEKTRFLYFYFCDRGIYPTVSEVLWQIIIFTISLIVTLIMKKIPLIKKLI